MLTDLRYALRMLAKAPGFAAVVVAILALGIGANTAIFSAMDSCLLKALPYDKPDELVSVYESLPQQGLERFSAAGPKYLDWRRRNRVFQEIGALTAGYQTLTGAGEPAPVAICQATPSYLRVFRLRAASGRLFSDDEDQAGKNQVVVLSNSLWRKQFGGRPDAIGQTVRLDGAPYTIVGVLAPGGMASLEGGDLAFVPLAAAKVADGPGAHYYQVAARLREGVTAAQAQASMNVLAGLMKKENGQFGDWSLLVVNLHDDMTQEFRRPPVLLLLQIGVLMVLLIACANTANLFLARLATRRREISIRMAIGGGRGRLVRQLLAESLLLALLGGAAGTWLALLGVALFNRWLEAQGIQFWSAISLNREALLFSIALATATGIVFGLLPALQTTQGDPAVELKGSGAGEGSNSRHRRTFDILAAAEIALALALLVVAGTLGRDLAHLQRIDPGFDPAKALTLRTTLTTASYPDDARRNRFVAAALERIAGLPGVGAAAAADVLPMSGSSTWDLKLIAADGKKRIDAPGGAQVRRISPDYFRAMGGTVLRGRAFAGDDRAGATSVAIVNQALAKRFLADRDPIGAYLDLGDGIANPHLVVGVVKDERVFGLTGDAPPVVYVPAAQGWFKGAQASYGMAFVVRSDRAPATMIQPIQAALRSLDPEMAFADVHPMAWFVDSSILSQRIVSHVSGAFSLAALLLAALGIYGVMAANVAQRTREIGIRMALGAQSRGILALVIGRGMLVTGAGLGLGFAGALACTRLLKAFVSGASALDPWVFAAGTACLTGVALVSCWLPARRAARVDPMTALRAE